MSLGSLKSAMRLGRLKRLFFKQSLIFTSNQSKKIFSILGVVALAFFLTGCTQGALKDLFVNRPVSKQAKQKQAQIQEQNAPKNTSKKLLYISSKNFRYYDYATFGVNARGEIILELFAAGKSIGTIEINKRKMCILNDCVCKIPAAKRFFGKVSYGDLFDDILLGRDIFRAEGLVIESSDAIVQRFQKNGEMIYYRRTKEGVLFKNMTTGVTVSLFVYEPQKIVDYEEDEEEERERQKNGAMP